MTYAERIKRLAEWIGWERKDIYGAWVPPGAKILSDLIFRQDWNPLTSLDHARILINNLTKKGYRVELTITVDSSCCDISREKKPNVIIVHTCGTTTALAICQAVERLMEVEEK
jgi:hypothetical protein